MPPVYQIKFLPSGETREFYGSRGDDYELEDGTHLDVRSGPVWSRRFGHCRGAESHVRGCWVIGLVLGKT